MVARYNGCPKQLSTKNNQNNCATHLRRLSPRHSLAGCSVNPQPHLNREIDSAQHFQTVPANCERQFNTNLLLPRRFFGSPVFASNMSKDWIGLLPTRQQAPTFVFHSHMLRDSADFWRRYMGSAHIGRNCTSLRRTLTRIARPLPRKLPHHRPLENTKAHKEEKIQPGGQPQLCPSLESPTSSPHWTSFWQPGSTDFCIFASMHPFIMHPCIQHLKGGGSVAGLQQTGTFAESVLLLLLRVADCLLGGFTLRFQVIQLVAQQFLTTESRNEMKCGKALL